MSQYNELQPGNLVEYRGSLGHKKFVQIREIGKAENGHYPVWFAPRFEWEKEFVGYSDQIWPIFLVAHYLEKLGFQFSKETRRHSLGKICIGEFRIISGEGPMNLCLEDWGFRVIPDSKTEIKTREDIEKYTVPLLYVHSLQNYLAAAGQKNDFSALW